MALYVRHSAWLDAVPQREGKKDMPENTVSRRDAILAKGRSVDMPHLECGDYLIRHLYDIGPTLSGGMGNGPVTYSEIEAWQRVTGIQLLPWEAALLKRLSGEYLAESHAATKHDRPAPFGTPPAMRRSTRSEIERKLDSFFD
jgi:hypothetical protein